MTRKNLVPIVLTFLLAGLMSLQADLSTAITLKTSHILYQIEDDSFGLINIGNGSLQFNSKGNSNVKGELKIDCIISDAVILDIPKAYIRIRFPWFNDRKFRVTLGKTRVTWGNGFFFNAGDVIFGSSAFTGIDFTASEIWTQTDWLIDFYFPLGDFSYIEFIALPHPSLQSLYVELDQVDPGGRITLDFTDITVEGGYLYKASEEIHFPYLSLSGYLLVDYYLSAALKIPNTEVTWEDIDDSLSISAGFFHNESLESGGSISFRLEAGITPYGLWEEKENPDPYVSPVYGLYLFPDITYAPADTFSVGLRSVISPVDLSAMLLPGVTWNIYQGFNLSSFLSVMIGDEDDIFGWDGKGDLSWILQAEYIFGS